MNINNGVSKNIVFFDIDNTIVDGYTQKYFIKFLFQNKYVSLFHLFLIYCWFIFYKINLIRDTEGAMVFFLKFLKGFNKQKLDALVDSFFSQFIKPRIFDEIVGIIEHHKKSQDYVVFISTVINPIGEKIAKYFGVQHVICTELEAKNNLYTGFVKGGVLDGERKKNKAQQFLNKIGDNFNFSKTIFYSDHHSDLPLLYFVDERHVVNPSKKLFLVAKNNNWEILTFNKK